MGPSVELKRIGTDKKELAERHILRLCFWEQLLSRAKSKGVLLHAQRAPSKDSWISGGAGVRSGISYTYVAWLKDETAVELWIDTGDRDENKRIFDQIIVHKTEIEKAFGGALSWERLDEKRGSRIRYILHDGVLLTTRANGKRFKMQ